MVNLRDVSVEHVEFNWMKKIFLRLRVQHRAGARGGPSVKPAGMPETGDPVGIENGQGVDQKAARMASDEACIRWREFRRDPRQDHREEEELQAARRNLEQDVAACRKHDRSAKDKQGIRGRRGS